MRTIIRANKGSITVLASDSKEQLEKDGATVSEKDFDSLKEAKARAKFVLTDEFARYAELSAPLGYAEVRVNGEVEAEFERHEERDKWVKE